MKIDEVNIGIIRELRQGKKSFRKIADKLGISENTVRARANRLQDEGVLEIQGLVDPASLPDHRVVIVGIKLSDMNIVDTGERISRLRGVVSVSVVTGRYDIVVLALFTKRFGLLEFCTEEIPRVQGIDSVETFVTYGSYNLKIPYIF